jgi:c-di-GMP-binding flagellar brake protein YcgR
MIVLLIEVLCVLILVMILSTIIIDERKNRVLSMHHVKLKGYWDGGERRSFERVGIDLDVKYFLNGTPLDARSKNISTKGVGLLLDEKFAKKTPLRLEIKLPNTNHIIRASGEVVWSNEATGEKKTSEKRLFNTGIKFSRFQSDDEKRLFTFIYNLQV